VNQLQGLSYTYNLTGLVNLLTSTLVCLSLQIVLLGILIVSPLLTLLLPVAFYLSALVLWNSIPYVLRHVAHRVTSSLTLNAPVSDLSTSPFLKIIITYSLTVLFLLSLQSPDISCNDQASSLHTHFAIIHPHFIHVNCLFVCLVSVCE